VGETRVDLLHLLEDLRDAYPGSLEETIVSEVVANALDSGARSVTFAADPTAATLTVVDDGRGMARRELARYHDLAASSKQRGRGIGFAGVGIKLGLLVCDEVVTETRRGKTHVATQWRLASRHRAPWKWVPPRGLVSERGTGVQLRLGNPLSPLLDSAFVEAAVRRHYQPLLQPEFDAV
jgi:HSP90 family molecular chaperone